MAIELHIEKSENGQFVTDKGNFHVMNPEREDDIIVNDETGELFEVLASVTDEQGALEELDVERA
ncbi:MAG: hypothetical protein LIO87_03775 [Eubacterium sp.]|nr:hypothetical protein [Eubacterium sp.]MCC8161127.1 hypothetical protein [Oscillospiraceae bacterium]